MKLFEENYKKKRQKKETKQLGLSLETEDLNNDKRKETKQ